jgi:hypothetical protein
MLSHCISPLPIYYAMIAIAMHCSRHYFDALRRASELPLSFADTPFPHSLYRCRQQVFRAFASFLHCCRAAESAFASFSWQKRYFERDIAASRPKMPFRERHAAVSFAAPSMLPGPVTPAAALYAAFCSVHYFASLPAQSFVMPAVIFRAAAMAEDVGEFSFHCSAAAAVFRASCFSLLVFRCRAASAAAALRRRFHFRQIFT